MTIRKLLSLGTVLLATSVAVVGCGSADEKTDVSEIQKEAKSAVPKDLPAVPPEMNSDLKTMGPRGSGG